MIRSPLFVSTKFEAMSASKDTVSFLGMKMSTNAAGETVEEVSKEWHAQLTQTAEAGAEAVKAGLNEVQAIVKDDKFLKGLGLGIAVGVLGYYLSDTYGGRGLGLASGAIDGVQGVLSGVAQGVSSIATTAKDGMGKFGRLLTGANMLSVEIPDKYVEVYQDNKEETKEVAEKAAVEYLAGKSVKVEKLPKKSKE